VCRRSVVRQQGHAAVILLLIGCGIGSRFCGIGSQSGAIETGLSWTATGGSTDLPTFPSARAPGWLEVTLSTHHLIAGGAIGLAVWDAGGPVACRVLHGRDRFPHGERVRNVDRPEDPRGAASGCFRFSIAGWETGRIRVPVQIVAEGPERPLRLELTLCVLESPVGDDTLRIEADRRPALTVLGGPSGTR